MTYTVLARRWRPRRFADLVGQEHVVQALVNGLESGRLHHAFLFTGTRGVGKTTIARILAKSLNCETGVSAEPCGQCAACQDIDQGRFVDLLEIDAASRTKVDDTREILDNVQYAPSRGRYKVYLIDEVHMLSLSSFNALLKTLEEPPPHVKFVLATTDPHKIPVTILSRCLRFNLRRLRPAEISHYLQHMLETEQIPWEEQGLALIARAADGSMRDSLSLLDQALAYGAGTLKGEATQRMLGMVEQRHLQRILAALSAADVAAMMAVAAELWDMGLPAERVLQDLARALHRMAVLQQLPDHEDPAGLEDAAARALYQDFDAEALQLYYQIVLHGLRDLDLAPDPRMALEMTLLRLAAFTPDGDDNPPRQPQARSSQAATRTEPRPQPAAARDVRPERSAMPDAMGPGAGEMGGGSGITSQGRKNGLDNVRAALGMAPKPAPASDAPRSSLMPQDGRERAPQAPRSRDTTGVDGQEPEPAPAPPQPAIIRSIPDDEVATTQRSTESVVPAPQPDVQAASLAAAQPANSLDSHASEPGASEPGAPQVEAPAPAVSSSFAVDEPSATDISSAAGLGDTRVEAPLDTPRYSAPWNTVLTGDAEEAGEDDEDVPFRDTLTASLFPEPAPLSAVVASPADTRPAPTKDTTAAEILPALVEENTATAFALATDLPSDAVSSDADESEPPAAAVTSTTTEAVAEIAPEPVVAPPQPMHEPEQAAAEPAPAIQAAVPTPAIADELATTKPAGDVRSNPQAPPARDDVPPWGDDPPWDVYDDMAAQNDGADSTEPARNAEEAQQRTSRNPARTASTATSVKRPLPSRNSAAPASAAAPQAAPTVAPPPVERALRPDLESLADSAARQHRATQAPGQALGDADAPWDELLKRLPITPITREFAANLLLVQRDADCWQFAIAPDKTALHTPRQEQFLAQALSTYFGRKLELRIRSQDGFLDTPAAAAAAQREAAKQAAVEAAHADPVIQRLQQRLGAMVIPGSIHPLDV